MVFSSLYVTYLLAALLAICIPVIIVLIGKNKSTTVLQTGYIPKEVGDFYDATTDKFLQVYGEIIQAYRTNNVEQYLQYTMHNAELRDDQKILDAGCGVGGPASYFASYLRAEISGLTISEVQVAKSKELMAAKDLMGSVHIQKGDYHQMDEIFGSNVFDRVIFLESFGHSQDQSLLIEKAYKVLKPGGILYIKDLFRREHANDTDGKKIDAIINAINQGYKYNVADLNTVLTKMRQLNFILLFVKTPEVKTSDFEHLTISNDFQELFDIAKIVSWDDYIFPVDFYEIKVMKPIINMDEQKHLYFLNRPDVAV